MNRPGSKLYKAALILALVPLLALSGLIQRRLNQDRVALGVTRGEPLGQTAPPVLAFTTVALGGFRGLIANALWIGVTFSVAPSVIPLWHTWQSLN